MNSDTETPFPYPTKLHQNNKDIKRINPQRPWKTRMPVAEHKSWEIWDRKMSEITETEEEQIEWDLFFLKEKNLPN